MDVAGPEYYVHSPCSGLFEPAFELGDEVEVGQPAGWIHFVDDREGAGRGPFRAAAR